MMEEILREHFRLKETIVTISARKQEHIDAAKRIDCRAARDISRTS